MRSGALAFACFATWASGCGSRTGVLGETPLFDGGLDGPTGSSPDSAASSSGGNDSSVGSPEAATPDSGSCTQSARCMVTLDSTGVERGQFTAIAVDSTNVYWTNAGGGTVMKVPIAGGPSTTLASGQAQPWGIAVDGINVYWANFGNGGTTSAAVEVPVQGGSPTTLESGLWSSHAIAVDSANVYWTNTPGAIISEPLGGGTPTTISTAGAPYGGSSEPGGLAVDGTQAFWTMIEDGFLLATPVDGGATVTLAPGRQACPQSIVVDTTNVYWAAGCANIPGGALLKMPKTGGTPSTLASATVQVFSAGGVATDGTSVYFTSFDPNYVSSCNGMDAGACDGAVVKVPVGGGNPVTLAAVPAAPVAIAIDATSVYWVSSAGIFRLTPR